MTERARNIVIAVVLAGVAALLVGLYVTNYQRHVQQGEDRVTVFVATKDIPAGTSGADAVAHGMLAQKTVLQRTVVPGSISKTNQISGSVAAQEIFEGEQITDRRFTQPAAQGIHGQLKGTLRGYQLQGDPNQLLAGTLRKGDHVDLVATFRFLLVGTQIKGAATRTVLRNVLVLRAPNYGGNESAVTKSFSGDADVILALTDAQAQKLDFTINEANWEDRMEPRWHLTLRGPVKSADSPESVTTMDSVILDGLSPKQRSRLVGKYGGE